MTTCPVTAQDIFGAMLRGEFKEMSDHDLDAFAGIEYTGFMTEINDCLVIADHGPGGILINVTEENGTTWMFEIEVPHITQIV